MGDTIRVDIVFNPTSTGAIIRDVNGHQLVNVVKVAGVDTITAHVQWAPNAWAQVDRYVPELLAYNENWWDVSGMSATPTLRRMHEVAEAVFDMLPGKTVPQ